MRGKLVLAGLEIRGTRNVLRHLLLYQQQNYFLPIFVNGLVSFKGIQLLCLECRTTYTPPPEELAAMNLSSHPESFYRTTGCDTCGHSGFSSRAFLTDVLTFNEVGRLNQAWTGLAALRLFLKGLLSRFRLCTFHEVQNLNLTIEFGHSYLELSLSDALNDFSMLLDGL